jgi:hypothetical protein
LKGFTLLNDSLFAISLEVVAKERRDRDISTSGIHYYSKALKGLRTAPERNALLERNSTKELCTDVGVVGLIACLACAVYEVR